MMTFAIAMNVVVIIIRVVIYLRKYKGFRKVNMSDKFERNVYLGFIFAYIQLWLIWVTIMLT